jgi:hypothetical protein
MIVATDSRLEGLKRKAARNERNANGGNDFR